MSGRDRWAMVGVAGILAVTLASCGGDDEDSTGTGPAAGVGAVAEPVGITAPSPQAVDIGGGALEPTQPPPAEGLAAVQLVAEPV
ncbi:MAG: hypothetical protein M3487_02095, partial [Actinomycetota bacterium]|nr:hypothetical protein [Actinomycetota bacterium]